MNAVELLGLRKNYGDRCVLDLARIEVFEGEFFVLLGPSGSGKTTLLRILAGLVRPDAGEVRLGGEDCTQRPPHERGIGFVFQGLALWPHLSVRGNLSLGLKREVPDPEERRSRILAAARELDIERFLTSRPGVLSGGERQRVALARALVRRPRLLLLDEPFSDLDARLRRTTARLVRRLHDEHGMTTILITHDRTDAHLLADRIGVMRHGRIVACGAPDVLHRAPGDTFTAEFLTDATLLRGRSAGEGKLHTPLGELSVEGSVEGEVRIAVRPEEILLGDGPLRGRVLGCEYDGTAWRCRLQVGDAEVAARHDVPLEAGTEIALTPPVTSRAVLREEA